MTLINCAAEYRELDSHVVVVSELHLGEPDASILVDRRIEIFNTVHPPCVFMVESAIYLVQLILQDRQFDINMDPYQIRFHIVVVN